LVGKSRVELSRVEGERGRERERETERDRERGERPSSE